MRKVEGVPKILVEMAIESLAEQLKILERCKAKTEDYVWAFFDGRVVPGRRLVMRQLRGGGLSAAEASTKIEAAIKSARRIGRPFALGVLVTTEEFPALLQGLAGDAAGVAQIAAWIAEPLPERWFRLAVISGSATQLQHASIDMVRRAVASRRALK